MSERESLLPEGFEPHNPRSKVEIETPATEPCGCDGSGSIKYVEREPDDAVKQLGHGLVAGPATTYGTHLCSCRRALPPRDGEARWWSSKTVYSAEWQGVVFEPTAEISVRGEVPVSDENYVLHRTEENFYWPTSVSVTFSDPDMGWLFPDEARELARLLVEAADAADAWDKVPHKAEA